MDSDSEATPSTSISSEFRELDVDTTDIEKLEFDEDDVTGELIDDAEELVFCDEDDDDAFEEVNLRGIERETCGTESAKLNIRSHLKAMNHFQESEDDLHPRSRSGVVSPPFCRICRDPEPRDRDKAEARPQPLVSPCRCRGSVAQVHVSCLEQWLAESDSNCCELCGCQYRTVRTPRYPVLTSIPAWAVTAGGAELLLDALALTVLTPVALLGTYLGLNADERVYVQVSLMAAIDMVYSAWLVMRLHYHFTRWHSWWRRKFIVKLVLDKTPSNIIE